MKKSVALFVLLYCYIAAFSQEMSGHLPPSFTIPGVDGQIETKFLPKPDLEQLKIMDELDAGNGNPYRVALNIPVSFDLNNCGTWTDLPDRSGRIWRLDIFVPEAQALILYYNDFYLPQGCELFLYNSNKKQVVGGFTSAFNTESGTFATEMISGEQVCLELFEPSGLADIPRLRVEEVGYVYRSAHSISPAIDQYKASGTCEVDINCSEGANWQDEKKGVCRILIKNGSSTFYCSGSLMNNTSNDCTPYILLADHCAYYSSYATAANLLQWLFYFHYEASTCGGTYTSGQKVKLGCTLKAHDSYGYTHTGSDFYLVQLSQTLTSADNIYYNGWSRAVPGSTGVGIHHPDGDVKKISTFSSTPSSYGVTHYSVTWVATANGHGVTEGGSSGSPIFNSSGQVFGTLTGGSSSCTTPTSQDIYGKVSYHWTSNGSTPDKQLQPWLDPGYTNVTYLNGSATCVPAGMNEAEALDAAVYIYPNPSSDFIHLGLGELTLNNPRIKIHSCLGPLVCEKQLTGFYSGELTIDLSGQPSGLYFLSLEASGHSINKKFMIVH